MSPRVGLDDTKTTTETQPRREGRPEIGGQELP